MKNPLAIIMAFAMMVTNIFAAKTPAGSVKLGDLEGSKFSTVIVHNGAVFSKEKKEAKGSNHWSAAAGYVRHILKYGTPQGLCYKSTVVDPNSALLNRYAPRGDKRDWMIKDGLIVADNKADKDQPIVPATPVAKEISKPTTQPTSIKAGLPDVAEALTKVGEVIANDAKQMPVTVSAHGTDTFTSFYIMELVKSLSQGITVGQNDNKDQGNADLDFDPDTLIFPDGTKVGKVITKPAELITVEITAEQLTNLRAALHREQMVQRELARQKQLRADEEKKRQEDEKKARLAKEAADKAWWDKWTPWMITGGCLILGLAIILFIRHRNLRPGKNLEKKSFDELQKAQGHSSIATRAKEVDFLHRLPFIGGILERRAFNKSKDEKGAETAAIRSQKNRSAEKPSGMVMPKNPPKVEFLPKQVPSRATS